MESFKELFEMVKEYTRQYVIDSKELSENRLPGLDQKPGTGQL